MKFGNGKFFRQFWENLEEIRIGTGAEFGPKLGLKKTLSGELQKPFFIHKSFTTGITV